MTPTPANDSSDAPNGAASSSINPPSQTDEKRPRRRRRRRGRQAKHWATVWCCHTDELPDGLGLLAGWLFQAIVRITTRYTRAGDRVLLLAPPSPPGPDGPRGGSHHDPFTGLVEAAWTLTQLGRSVHTWNGDRPENRESDRTSPPEQSKSGPRPDRPAAAVVPDQPRAPADAEPNPDRFDLIITTVLAETVDQVQDTAWADLLMPSGVLAVITHGDCFAGRLRDPSTALVSTMRSHFLYLRDHVIVTEVPLIAAITSQVDESDSHSGPPSESVPVAPVRAHSDLYVFTPSQPSIPPRNEEEPFHV